jgi:hypothetical protein
MKKNLPEEFDWEYRLNKNETQKVINIILTQNNEKSS